MPISSVSVSAKLLNILNITSWGCLMVHKKNTYLHDFTSNGWQKTA